MDQGKGGEGGGREAREEAAAVVQADGGGLDQGDGMGLEMVRFWIYFTGRAKRTCRWIVGSRPIPRLGT